MTGEQTRKYPWRLFWLLLGAAIVSVCAILPIAMELFPTMMAAAGPPPLPLPVLIALGVVQSLATLSIAIGVGILLGRKTGLGAPLLEEWLYENQPAANAGPSLKAGVLVGAAVGFVILIPLILLVPYLPKIPFVSATHIALWKRFLACLNGGIYEEILARLFLLTLLSWLGMKLLQREKTKLAASTFWVANIVVAILFGLGHLPSASLLMPITPLVVTAALLLNGIASISFGYLYWKRGLESAMIAHFSADFVIYVLGVALLRFLPLH